VVRIFPVVVHFKVREVEGCAVLRTSRLGRAALAFGVRVQQPEVIEPRARRSTEMHEQGEVCILLNRKWNLPQPRAFFDCSTGEPNRYRN
jgi:hypothetical protein